MLIASVVAVVLACASIVAATMACGQAFAAGSTVATWGSNQHGQLGDGLSGAEELYSDMPVAVKGLGEVVAVAQGADFKLALRSDGTVWAWGSDSRGQLGAGAGGHEGEASAIPVEVCASGESAPCAHHMSEVVAIAAGGQTAFALRSNGTMYSWGYGIQGQLGNGYAFAVTAPAPIALSGVSSIGAGAQEGFAVLGSGRVYSWGQNDEGQLGRQVAGTSTSATPGEVEGVSGAVAVAGGGDFASALIKGGTVKAWGTGTSGQLNVVGLSHVAAISAGWADGLALREDGSVWEWGSLIEEHAAPTQVGLPGGAIAISSDLYVNLALLANGTLETWGSNALRFGADLGIGEVLGPETCVLGWGPCSLKPTPVADVSGVGALAAGLAVGSAPGPTLLTFSDWQLDGSLTDRAAAQTVPLSGSFSGQGALHGQASGTLAFTAPFSFFGLHLSLGMRAVAGSSEPARATLEISSLSIDGIVAPVDCQAVAPIALNLTEPSAISASALDASGSFELPAIHCQGGLLSNTFLGFLLTVLISGEGNTYALTMEPRA
jgi:hypothetical protein